MKAKRTEATIFYDLLNAIRKEQVHGRVKVTRIQLMANLAFTKTRDHLQSMYELGFITTPNHPKITEHGYNYIKDFAELQLQAFVMGQEYNFNVGTPQIDTTVDNAAFLLEIAGTLEEIQQKLSAWSTSQKDSKKE